MKIRTVQWNIGGGKIRNGEADAATPESYAHEGVSYIVDKLKEYAPDIITFQESHADGNEVQAEIISKELGLSYFINDRYDESHIDATQGLCQSILSRFPIKNHSFEFFFNPHFRKTMDSGEEWRSHDKGISTCRIDTNEFELTVQTLHMIPFRKFGVEFTSPEAQKVRVSVENLLEQEKSPYVLQGDFNCENVSAFLPGIYEHDAVEAGGMEATTPKGRRYDHVFVRGLRVDSHRVDSSVMTDHFPLITELSN